MSQSPSNIIGDSTIKICPICDKPRWDASLPPADNCQHTIHQIIDRVRDIEHRNILLRQTVALERIADVLEERFPFPRAYD